MENNDISPVIPVVINKETKLNDPTFWHCIQAPQMYAIFTENSINKFLGIIVCNSLSQFYSDLDEDGKKNIAEFLEHETKKKVNAWEKAVRHDLTEDAIYSFMNKVNETISCKK